MSKFTIETLEHMFMYLGCANIVTQSAMDGAIPMASLLGGEDKQYVAKFEMAKMPQMPANWSTKLIWFDGDSLALNTTSNVHWSVISSWAGSTIRAMQAVGELGKVATTAQDDGYVQVHYSEINKFGKFEKFKIKRRRRGDVIVSKIYNPSWLFAFRKERMDVITSDNDAMLRKKQLMSLTGLTCGLAQSLPSYWQVQTKFEAICPSLTLLTDPTGVKEFWRLRDIPEGKKRRAALLHWVEAHWRQKRHDPDVEVYVRKQMRGREELTQGQFKAKIIASETDKLDLEIAKTERETMRRLKSDRRKRSRLLESKRNNK